MSKTEFMAIFVPNFRAEIIKGLCEKGIIGSAAGLEALPAVKALIDYWCGEQPADDVRG